MGLLRNLTAAEIVGQVFAARHQLGVGIRNVVFMGMGEPLDNLDNVIQAIRVLTDQRGLDIARRHITVSTVGLTAGIDRLARLDGATVNLAVSLNAPTDDIRSRLMPINRSISMAALQASLLGYPLARKSALFMEYVLIQGINDRQEHARALARYLAPMTAKLNLIPYNPAPGSEWQPPIGKSLRTLSCLAGGRKRVCSEAWGKRGEDYGSLRSVGREKPASRWLTGCVIIFTIRLFL